MNWRNLAKYFIHGIAFSMLFLIVYAVWFFIIFPFHVATGFFRLTPLAGRGIVGGFMVGFGLLSLTVGYLNGVITTFLWFPVKKSFWSALGHGIMLLVALLVVQGIFVGIPRLFAFSFYAQIVMFHIGVFINGFTGKIVAKGWRKAKQNEADTKH